MYKKSQTLKSYLLKNDFKKSFVSAQKRKNPSHCSICGTEGMHQCNRSEKKKSTFPKRCDALDNFSSDMLNSYAARVGFSQCSLCRSISHKKKPYSIIGYSRTRLSPLRLPPVGCSSGDVTVDSRTRTRKWEYMDRPIIFPIDFPPRLAYLRFTFGSPPLTWLVRFCTEEEQDEKLFIARGQRGERRTRRGRCSHKSRRACTRGEGGGVRGEGGGGGGRGGVQNGGETENHRACLAPSSSCPPGSNEPLVGRMKIPCLLG